MVARPLHPALRESRGASLLVTLVVLTVATVLVGAVLVLHQAQYRFLRRDAHRLQARYAAEAGVYMVLDSLQQNPAWLPQNRLVPLPDGQESRVTVEPFGGYLFVRSTSRYRRSRCTVRALAGEIPPDSFRNALVLWDRESSLHVAGRTRIGGPVVVGPRGLRRSTYRRRRFTGRIEGAVHATAGLQPPYFDGSFLERATDNLDELLGRSSSPGFEETYVAARHLPSENPVYAVPGSLHLTSADSTLLGTPVTLVAQGDLTLDGPLRYAPGTTFVAGRVLRLEDGVDGREGLFYGRDGIVVAGTMQGAGQFFSRAAIRVARGAYLHYPSVLYVTGEGAEQGAAITVEDGAAVDGTLVHPAIEPAPTQKGGRIVVAAGARARGALYNAHETELHGTIYGTVLTYQLYFYESPTHYVNWLKDATIDIGERPIPYLLPLRFSRRPRLSVLHWEIHTEEPDPAS